MSTMIAMKPRLGPCNVTLWPFQNEAIDTIREELKKGVRRTILHLFTGAGKTIVGMSIARKVIERGGRCMFMAATDELCDQALKKADYVGVQAELEKASSFARTDFDPDCVVASVQSMKAKRLASWPRDYFNLIIVDEAHHAIANSYKRILSHFNKAYVLGLTATVDRGDGEDIGQVFESIGFVRDLPFAWNAPPPGPYACDILPVKRDLGIDLRDIRRKKGDFTDDMLEARIFPHIEMLANLLKVESGDRATLIFTPQIKSAQGVATGLQNLGVKAEWTCGDDPNRKEKVRAYQDGELQMLASAQVFSEGFDAPHTSSLGMFRPTNSRSLYAQQVGRGVRTAPGKQDCVLIDPGFLTDKHDLVTAAELCDSPLVDSEMTEIIDELLSRDKQLTLKLAMAKAGDVQKERSVLRIQAKEREIKARRVSYSMRDVYNTLGVPWRAPGNAIITSNPATDKQIAFLQKRGVMDLEGMSKTRANTLIGVLLGRMKAGMATHKQVAVLIKYGTDPAMARDMKFEEASEKLDTLIGGRR